MSIRAILHGPNKPISIRAEIMFVYKYVIVVLFLVSFYMFKPISFSMIPGHSATFEPDPSHKVKMTNIPHRPGNYVLHDFHFHYGGVAGRIFEPQVK